MDEKKQIRVDWNEKMIYQDRMGREGKITEAEQYRIKMEALKEITDSGIDYCSCPEKCPHHGKCWECVLIHRGHRDHLPYCFWDMINERLYHLQRLTEGSLMKYEPSSCAGCAECTECGSTEE